MRIDVVSIFPDYLAPLELSLAGKARAKGLLEIHVHDLRRWAHDRHHTVDDSPYGGGAGMVMKPEPWGEALDELLLDETTLIVPTPSGARFTQAMARELAGRPRLVFACGRYEGIDQRVIDHARSRVDVREISVGDYVLNGGEVAALAMTEAVVRLLPGFMGNPDSLVEESHEDGLLEYPVYTKPASWRGLDVPDVLLGGNHAAIAAWRNEQAVRRTVARRPDLAHPASALGLGGPDDVDVRPAQRSDAGELLTLQRACWAMEAEANPGVPLAALHETLADVEDWIDTWRTFVVRSAGRLVGAVRARGHDTGWDIGRILVAPDLQGRGLDQLLLECAEQAAPADVATYALVAGTGSVENQRMYKKAGYRPRGMRLGTPEPGTVLLTKPRR